MRRCAAYNAAGRRCGAAPLRDRAFCRMHDPEQAEAVAEARRLGGLRRRREATVAQAYDLNTLSSGDEVRRLLDIAVLEALGLENSLARVRALTHISSVAIRLVELTSIERRLELLDRDDKGEEDEDK